MRGDNCLRDDRTISSVKERVKLSNIIPGYNGKEKVKVRVLHSIYFFWNSIKTILEYYQENVKTNLMVVLGQQDRPQDISVLVDQIIELGVEYCIYDKYKIDEDKPDIFIFNVAHNKNYFNSIGGPSWIRENASFIAVVPYDQTTKMAKEAFAEYYNSLDDLKQDLLIVNPLNYDVFANRYPNTYVMPNPKNDIIWRTMMNDYEINQNWRDKVANRKVVLYSTVHGHEAADVFAREITFDVYIKSILDYFSKNKDIVLLFRPHPVLIEEYVNMHHIWTKSELKSLKDYFDRSDNLIWDDTPDYASAFKLSDALLVDTTTGVSFSYLPTRKPICIVYRSKESDIELNPRLVANFYKAYCWGEIKGYFDMVKDGLDDMYDKRMRTLLELIPEFDGKNGERIGRFVFDNYMGAI